jgi:hypothetical protein
MDIPFGHAARRLCRRGLDVVLRRRIPAVTIHGLSVDWLSILHTEEDQPSKVNPTNVYLGYRLALALLTRVDAMSCDAFR